MEHTNGDYVRLEYYEQGVHGESVPPNPKNGKSLWWWAKLIVVCVLLGVLVIVLIKRVGPFFMSKGVIPIINWVMTTLNTPVLAIVIFASVALFPLILLPSTPSMWVAGMAFGYGIGFLLVIAGISVGVSLPYFIGSLFRHKIKGWLEKCPKQASIIRLAGEGNLFQQIQAITLIRISPFPYVLFNYAVVATDVKYIPYLMGSLVGLVPEAFVALYSGILIRKLADATRGQKGLSTPLIIFDVVGFFATMAATAIIMIYARRRLNQQQEEEELLLLL